MIALSGLDGPKRPACPALEGIGSTTSLAWRDQNGGRCPQYFRANQNAERLHGSQRVVDVQSDWSSDPILTQKSLWLCLTFEMQRKNVSRKEMREITGAKVLSKNLSQDARDWIILAMDPFHDYSRQLAGYPDADCSATIVSCYQYELDVSKPAGSVGNWDAHVFTLPTLAKTTLTPFNVANGPRVLQAAAGEAQISVGPLNVFTADAGQPLCPSSDAAFVASNLEMHNIDCLTDALPGRSRVIGWGMEVVNTSAEIYKQGALTMYRMPQDDQVDQFTVCNSANTRASTRLARLARMPPPTADLAMKLHGSVQWAAAEGLYMVVPQNSVENKLTCPVGADLALSDDAQYVYGQHVYQTFPTEIDSPTTTVGIAIGKSGPAPPYHQKYIPFNTAGAFLTGLSPQTTLRIKMKMYVEMAPTPKQANLVVLATPSAAYDYKALALYSAAVGSLPVAVRVSENAAGDWFRRVLDIISMVAPPLGLAVGMPALGTAVSSAAGIVKNAIPKKEEKEKVPTKVKRIK